MMLKIWKFELPDFVVQKVILILPGGAKILSVVELKGNIAIYVQVNPDATAVQREFVFVMTGTPLELPEKAVFIGTVVLENGDYVLHVFDLGEV